MKISHQWLQTYFDETLPSPEEVAGLLGKHSFEIEGLEKVGSDTIIDIDVLPNRAHDCLSHRGMARELARLMEVPLKAEENTGKDWNESKVLTVSLSDASLCRRYSGAVIEGIAVKPSPDWLKERLEAIGQKSINNIVDATNYVLFSLGQPLHAFDLDKMKAVDGAYSLEVTTRDGENPITLLTDDEYIVGEDTIVIIDSHSDALLDIAGVKGGKHAMVDSITKNITLVSANFEPVTIRKTSQKLKLRTDASLRLENEITPEMTLDGLHEAVPLILDIAGGAFEGYVDVYPRPRQPYKVGVSRDEVNKLLGTDMIDDTITDIFDRFGFEYKKVQSVDEALETIQKYADVPYKLGASISYEAPEYFDCSSLTAYAYAQGGIALPRMSVDQYVWGTPVEADDLRAGDLILANTHENKICFESIEYMPGTPVEAGVDHVGMYIGDGKVMHATRKHGKVVVEDIKESASFHDIVGYRRVSDNCERFVVTIPAERLDLRIKEDLIEEIGRVYGYDDIPTVLPHKDVEPPHINKLFFFTQKVRDILYGLGFSEVYNYAFAATGDIELMNPLAQDKKFMRTNLRDGMQKSLEFNGRNADLLGTDAIKIFEIGTVYTTAGEYTSLSVGILSPKVKPTKRQDDVLLRETLTQLASELNIEFAIEEHSTDGVFEINFEHILEKLSQPMATELRPVHFVETDDVVYQKISPYPFMLRDIAVWVPDEVTADDVLAIIKEQAGALLVQTILFDEYRKDGKVSYAFRLVFQSQEKTLTDEEINKIMETITNVLNNTPEWEVR